MDKQSLKIIFSDCFKEEGNCVILHFIDGSELIIDKLPMYFNLHFSVDLKYAYNNEIITETYMIPYSSVLYVTLTNDANLKIIAKQYDLINGKLMDKLD